MEDQTLMRPGYGEGNRQEELAVEVDGKEVRQLEITIQERKYTEKEKRELTERAIKELEQILPGQNKSLDEVREDLVFPETLMDGAVTAQLCDDTVPELWMRAVCCWMWRRKMAYWWKYR